MTVEGKDGTLPGTPAQKYVKVPRLLFMPLALVLGALFVIFLPLIGLAMVPILLVRKALGSKGLVNVTRASCEGSRR